MNKIIEITKNSDTFTFKMGYKKEVFCENISLDGQETGTKKSIIITEEVRVLKNGETLNFSRNGVKLISKYDVAGRIDKAYESGARVRIGDLLLGADFLELVNEWTELVESDETSEEVKKEENRADEKCNRKEIADAEVTPLCKKCGSYCYGDCEAN